MGSTSTPSLRLGILFPFHGNYFLATGLPLRAVVTASPTQTKAKKQVSARGRFSVRMAQILLRCMQPGEGRDTSSW